MTCFNVFLYIISAVYLGQAELKKQACHVSDQPKHTSGDTSTAQSGLIVFAQLVWPAGGQRPFSAPVGISLH